MWPTSFDALTHELVSSRGAIQLTVLLATLILAWLVAERLRAHLPDSTTPGLAKIGSGSVHRVVLPLAFLAFTWVARVVLARYQDVMLLNLALPLIASYAVIRLAIYLLRHLIPPSPLLKASERAIAICVWLLVALYLVGILPELVAGLDDVRFSVNKQTVSLKHIIEGLLLLGIALFVALALSRIVEKRIMATTAVDIGSRVIVTRFLRVFAFLLAVLIALPLVGIDLTLLSVFGGALGVGLGFGLQKITSNYVSGFIILLDKSTRLGDTITVDNRHGKVESIRARYTVVRAPDGTEAIIPNDTFITNTVLNHSHTRDGELLAFVVTLKHSADISRAQAAINTITRQHPQIEKSPEPEAYVARLHAGGADISVKAWCAMHDTRDALRSQLLTEIAAQFATAGIVIGESHD